jgi:hypothetical protein
MSAYRNRILLLCPAAARAAANAAATQALGPGNEDTFSAPYSPTGNAPATHYAACSLMTDGFARGLAGLAAAHPFVQAWIDGPDPELFADLAGLPQIHLGPFDPHEALAAAGLQPVSA